MSGDVGGSKEQIEKLREVVELPLLHPEKFAKLGIDPPKGVLCYGPPDEDAPRARGGGSAHAFSFASSAASWCKSTLVKGRD